MINEKINYDKLMMEEINSLNGERKSVLLHTCCGPCSSACIERLRKYLDVTVYFYNPNVEPFEEYLKRKETQIKLLKDLDIPYIDADYDNDYYRSSVKGLESEREGGARCPVCFKIRLKRTAEVAKENNFDYFCTSLTVSPHKNSDIINKIGHAIGESIGIKFLYSDFKKREGYKRSIELSKEYELYRQDYCGCLFAKDWSELNEKK
jgi:predicted adenine nucleotide alpha hydrolase (AANH) superfamily ATPase